MMRAEIRMSECDSSEFLVRILRPETRREIPRTEVDLNVRENDLVITVRAEDVNALRAALNSYMRWLKLALDTGRTVGGA
jgi:KEOPS complex subunit Pcc1